MVGPATRTVLTKAAGSLVESGCATGAAPPVGLLLAAGLGDVDVDTGGDAAEVAGLKAGLEIEFELEDESWALPTLLLSPVKDTDQTFSPPPVYALALAGHGGKAWTCIYQPGNLGSLCCTASPTPYYS